MILDLPNAGGRWLLKVQTVYKAKKKRFVNHGLRL